MKSPSLGKPADCPRGGKSQQDAHLDVDVRARVLPELGDKLTLQQQSQESQRRKHNEHLNTAATSTESRAHECLSLLILLPFN